MRCNCCGADVPLARKVKLRPWRDLPEPAGAPYAAVYEFYVKELNYRWVVVCLPCYRQLDNGSGLADIAGRAFNLAGTSRRDRAAVLDEAKYQAWQQREADKLGL
jgi:hypothetical protein